MLEQYRFTIWYMALSDGALQFLSPMIVDALDEAMRLRRCAPDIPSQA